MELSVLLAYRYAPHVGFQGIEKWLQEWAGVMKRPPAFPLICMLPLVPVTLFLSLVHPFPVQISFLTETNSLSDTVQLLQTAGCPTNQLAVFERAVHRYNNSPPELDLRRFPQRKNDVYSFHSASTLVDALPHLLFETKHAYELNCFDTVFLLFGDQLEPTDRSFNCTESFLTLHNTTNGQFLIKPAVTPREAFELTYQEWYLDASQEFVMETPPQRREWLTANLFRFHDFPALIHEQDLQTHVHTQLKTYWKERGMRFPAKAELVLVHDVDLPRRLFITTHAALFIPNNNGFVYLEKAGGSGPFVRLNVKTRSDVQTWLAKTFAGPPEQRLGYTHHFVTFNDQRILEFK